MSLKHTIILAKNNPIRGSYRLAATIYDKNRLVASGVNSYKTHPLQARFGKNKDAIHLHAEIAALVNSREDVTGMTMYVARALRNGTPAIAKPCTGCQRALLAFGLKDVIWTE